MPPSDLSSLDADHADHTDDARPPVRRPSTRGVTSTDVFCLVLLVAVVARLALPGLWSQPAMQAWTTVFAAICIQAAPYLVLGVTVSTAIAVFVPPSFFARVLPSRPALAVPVAGLAGAALPGCECGSVPVAASLMRRGVAAAPAIAFLLAAPAINPVVLIATSVAFPNRPEMVLGRFLASLLTAVVVGWLWMRLGRTPPLPERFVHAPDSSRAERARATAAHDLAQSLGLLTVGAATAATINVTLPPTWLDGIAGHVVLGVLALAALAVIIAVCSEADAFIASSFVRFSPTAQLAFMTVGPAVDVKLIAMQIGTFGGRVAARLAPLAFVVAVGSAALIGWWLL